MQEKKWINYMCSALVSAYWLKNKVYYNKQILVSCLSNYLGLDAWKTRNAQYFVFVITVYRVLRSQPLTLLRHFESPSVWIHCFNFSSFLQVGFQENHCARANIKVTKNSLKITNKMHLSAHFIWCFIRILIWGRCIVRLCVVNLTIGIINCMNM